MTVTVGEKTVLVKRLLVKAYFVDFGWRRAVTPSSTRKVRLTRASTKRSRIWTMTPRCFLAMGEMGPRRTGGDIFSKLNAGIVYPLVAELKHSWNSPRYRWMNCLPQQLFHPV
jgi:hypothetical protein